MAIDGGDGSIVLTVNVDKTELEKAISGIKDFGKQGKKSTTTFSNGLTTISTKLKSLAVQLGLVFSVGAIINFSKTAGQMATQTEASVQRLVEIYGEASKSVENFIDANAMALGLSRSAASSYASVYGNLFSVWADQATNAALTNNYLNMTAVVASKTGRTVADVQERIRSGLLGNTEAIEDLGIFVNVKTIEMTDAFRRIADGRSWEQLGAYEQQQIRTMAILEQSTQKYGTEVADTTALTRAQWTAAYEDFQATWGQVVNKILMPIMKWATTALSYLNGVLTGFFNLSQETVKQSDATSESVKNQKDLKKAVKETNKEAKKSLASFDEINVLTEQSTDNAETSGAGGATTMPETEDFKIAATIDTASFEEGIDVGKRLRETFEPLIDVFGEFGAVVVIVVTALLGFLAVKWLLGWLTGLGKPLTKVSAGFGKFLDKLGSAGIAIAVLGGLALVIGSITDLITAFSESGLTLGEVAGLLGIALGEVVGAFGLLLGILQLLNPSWQDIVFAAVVFTGLAAAISSVTELIDVFANSGLTLGEVAAVLGMVLGEILLLITGITIAASVLGTSPMALAAVAAIGLVVIGILEAMAHIFEALAPLITAVSDATHKFFSNIDVYVENVIKAITKMINFLFSAIEYLANNLIIPGINVIIRGLNKIAFDVPEWVPIIGGKTFGFNLKEAQEISIPRFIPKLAQGAVIPPNREFLAVLGDQKHGTNIEAPLDTIKQAVAEVLAQVNVGSSGYNGRIEVPVIIDGREIARAVREAEGNMGSQTVFGGFANAH